VIVGGTTKAIYLLNLLNMLLAKLPVSGVLEGVVVYQKSIFVQCIRHRKNLDAHAIIKTMMV